ncbi:MAG: glycine oxidase ThiO [Methylococcales bacterium]|jgi:glycine oxidase|nr:glycine oxidase ThiO [Methylococcales bacterium]
MHHLIIGGGINGLMTAFELINAGCTVTLIEKNQIGQESSWAGGGILSPLYPWRYDDAISQLAKLSQSTYPNLLNTLHEKTGIDPECQQSGLSIFDIDDEEQAKQWASKYDYPSQILSAKEFSQQEPKYRPSAHKVFHLPSIQQVRNPRLLKAFKAYLIQSGVKILEQHDVLSFKTTNNKVTQVITNQGKFQGESITICAGAWSNQLAEKLGHHLPIIPIKGQMIIFKATPGFVSKILLSKNRYIIPRKDGRTLVGSSLEYSHFEKEKSQQARDELKKFAFSMIPELQQFNIEHHWAGLRPGSPNGIPFICQHPDIENLYFNAGQFRNGVVLAPASATLLVDLVLNRTPSVNPKTYAFEQTRTIDKMYQPFFEKYQHSLTTSNA